MADLPECFGNWNTAFKNFDRWAKDGTWDEGARTRPVQVAETLGDLDWVPFIDSTIVRASMCDTSPPHRGR